MVLAVKKFRQYIQGAKIFIYTDHMAWKRGVTSTDPSGRINRWIMELSTHDISIIHIPGKDNVVADALSRLCYISVHDTKEILKLYHNDVTGHGGFITTKNSIPKDIHWDTMNRDIKNHIDTCEACLRYKQPRMLKSKLRKIKANGFWQKVGLDIMFRNYNGINYLILAMIDYFSRFCWLKLIPTTNSADTIKVLKNFFPSSGFGVPRLIICDEGTTFNCREFKSFLMTIGTDLHIVSSGNQKANGLVERSIKTLKSKLNKVFFENPNCTLGNLLERVQESFNNSFNRVTGKSPYEFLYGVKKISEKESKILNDFKIGKEYKNLEVEYYNKKASNRFFKIGDLVAFRNFHPKHKNDLMWLRPAEICEQTKYDSYWVKFNGKVFKRNIKDLHKWTIKVSKDNDKKIIPNPNPDTNRDINKDLGSNIKNWQERVRLAEKTTNRPLRITSWQSEILPESPISSGATNQDKPLHIPTSTITYPVLRRSQRRYRQENNNFKGKSMSRIYAEIGVPATRSDTYKGRN